MSLRMAALLAYGPQCSRSRCLWTSGWHLGACESQDGSYYLKGLWMAEVGTDGPQVGLIRNVWTLGWQG